MIILQKEQFISPIGPHGLFSYLSAFWRCFISADAYLCSKWSNVRLTSNFLTSSFGPTNDLRMLQRLKRPISPRPLWQSRTHCCPSYRVGFEQVGRSERCQETCRWHHLGRIARYHCVASLFLRKCRNVYRALYLISRRWLFSNYRTLLYPRRT